MNKKIFLVIKSYKWGHIFSLLFALHYLASVASANPSHLPLQCSTSSKEDVQKQFVITKTPFEEVDLQKVWQQRLVSVFLKLYPQYTLFFEPQCISEENLTRLFEPYFTSKLNGIGLGLASTLNIIKAHKGMIEVKSVVGEGTSFYISFDTVD